MAKTAQGNNQRIFITVVITTTLVSFLAITIGFAAGSRGHPGLRSFDAATVLGTPYGEDTENEAKFRNHLPQETPIQMAERPIGNIVNVDEDAGPAGKDVPLCLQAENSSGPEPVKLLSVSRTGRDAVGGYRDVIPNHRLHLFEQKSDDRSQMTEAIESGE